MRRNLVFFTLLLLPLLLAPALSSLQAGRNLYVNNVDATCQGQAPCYATIQAAVNDVSSGGTVVIQAGTYAERVVVQGKNNFAQASEADRITIEADPLAFPGSVVLTGASQQCSTGEAIRVVQSKFLTIRGLTITGAGAQAIALQGAPNQNQAVHIERNRIFGTGIGGGCDSGITVMGNSDTLIVNNLIYANSRNGITFLGAGSSPHHIVNNTIHGNGWNGIAIERDQEVFAVNNVITRNGTAGGETGGRFGFTREVSASPQPQAVHLLNNLMCGNRLAEIDGPALDATDAGNLTPTGAEGPGVSASPGCEAAFTLYGNLNGADGLPGTADDDFTLSSASPATDRGIDTRTLGLNPLFSAILEADFSSDGVRPSLATPHGTLAFDLGALELTDEEAPAITILQPAAGAFVRQNVTLQAEATDGASGVDTVAFTIDGQTVATLSNSDPAQPFLAAAAINTTALTEGNHSLGATATDRAGNTSSTPGRTLVVDNTTPDTQITGGPQGEINETAATFAFTGTDNLTPSVGLLFAWRLDGGTFTSFSAATTASLTALTEGSHSFEVKARDLAGNEDPTPAGRSFTVRLGPAITAVDPPGGPVGSEVAIQGTGFDPAPGKTIVRFNGVQAVIFKITQTSIRATVPITATTGRITAETSKGVGTSGADFVVLLRQDFSLSVSPEAGATVPGTSAAYAVRISSTGPEPFTGLAALSVNGLPAGVTASFTPSLLSSSSTGILTLSAASSTAVGSYPIEMRAASQIEGRALTRTAQVTLTVQASGQTVWIGQVRDENDRPLAGVSIKQGGSTLTELGVSDAGGNFFITLSVSGPQIFLIDGSTANTPSINYSTIPVTLDIQPGVVNTLGFTPRLVGQPVAKLTPITPGQGTVLTHPDVPGFTMTIASGAEIIGWDGNANTQFSVTAVPVDRSPLPPLPPELTVRRIYLFSFGKMGGGVPTGNISIDTPNDVAGLPGEKVDLYFFNEAPDGTAPNQWEKYGTGTISSDGARIISDVNPATGLPYGIPRFCCGARVNAPQPAPPRPGDGPTGGESGAGQTDGDPVDTATGFFYVDKTDIVLPGIVPIAITRTHRTQLANAGPFGLGTSWPYDIFLQPPPDGSPDALILFTPGNRQDIFSRQADGSFVNTTSPPLRGTVVTDAAGGMRLLKYKDGSLWRFDSAGRLISQADRNGNTLTLTRDGGGRVLQITEPAGRSLVIGYTGSRGIDFIRDPIGREVRYGYDTSGRLETVTDPAGGITRYTYDAANRIVSITDARGITFLTNEYDDAGRVIRQTQPDGGVWTYDYIVSGNFISQCTVTNPGGHKTTYRFNSAGFLISQTDANGQTTTFERQAGSNLLLATIDPLDRKTSSTYDANGNVTSITDATGKVRTFEYEPVFNKVSKITDPLGQVTRFEYDNRGNLTATIDPAGARTATAYNALGQPVSTTDPLGNTTRFEYDSAGNLSGITDPLGNRTSREYDAVSRPVRHVDPRGRATAFTYDALNRRTRVTDALGGLTRFSYDGNGNLLTVTDARDNTVTHAYDAVDRLATRTDPVGAVESFGYDGVGNLSRHTDRKGQVSTFAYDALNRRLSATYADGSTASFGYDAAGRRIRATNSLGSEILNSYDALDRLLAQTSGLGTVGYQYDALGRRTEMTAPGQAPVTYTYDAASRLRTIKQAPLNPATIDYDASGRRTRLALPNGVSTEYQYDAGSRLTAMIYRNAAGILGDLTYQYDAVGNRTRAGGSFARTLLPDPVASATYNAANRQLTFGENTLTYDTNGNLTAIAEPGGMTALAWDARNRLIGMNGSGLTASFTYDALGRRIGTEINGRVSQYVYDRDDITQEFLDGMPVSYLRSLNTDEALVRQGAEFYLADPLGSTLALTDPAGALQTQYTYDPFGKVTAAGSSTNPFQYTGRENDGTRLYFYRARYYSPELHRFISEDPVGLLGGAPNFYVYVDNNTLRFTDPLGLDKDDSSWDDWLHGGLDAVGIVDPTGIADGLNALIYAFQGEWGYAGISAAAMIPYVGDLGKAGKYGARFSDDAAALIDLAKQAKRNGVTPEEAKILKEWAQEYKVPSRGPEIHPNRPHGKDPHIHIGPIDHIPLR